MLQYTFLRGRNSSAYALASAAPHLRTQYATHDTRQPTSTARRFHACSYVCVGVGWHCRRCASPGRHALCACTRHVQPAVHSTRARAMSNPPCTLRVRAPCPTHDYIAPPMTTSPPRTAPDDMSLLMESGTTDAVMGNSTGAVLTTRTTLPEPGVSRTQKKGRSQPSSV